MNNTNKNKIEQIYDEVVLKTKIVKKDLINTLPEKDIEANKQLFIKIFNKRDFNKISTLFKTDPFQSSLFIEMFLVYCYENDILTDTEYTNLLFFLHMNGSLLIKLFKLDTVLKLYNKALKPYLEIQECEDIYSKLDDKFVVYRGSYNFDRENAHLSLCWSLERKVAERFTKEPGINCTNRVIFEGSANKKDIYGILFPLKEYEIVINPLLIENIKQTDLEDIILN